ncbi:hypothetical protein [Streptomyces canus]|uniref:hypothetical protein n=1 Tax=Streptomyces canus TaxID=58343 RepID=UPI000746951C|nr:hypothetical protein [Streptomyces canus]KUN11132.1 hypothetical protein AQI96_21750 [Streptomyces canus]
MPSTVGSWAGAGCRRWAIAGRVPDTGAQRGDGREVLRARAEGERQIGPDTLHWLLAESWDIDPSLSESCGGCCGPSWSGWPGAARSRRPA